MTELEFWNKRLEDQIQYIYDLGKLWREGKIRMNRYEEILLSAMIVQRNIEEEIIKRKSI